MKDIAINQIKLSNRAKNCLKKNDIFLLSQMMQLTDEDIYKFRNAGEKTVEEIISLQQQIKDSSEYIDVDDIAFVLEKENSRPELMIHMAFPNLRGKEVDVMSFEDKNGLYSMNTKIEDINFSVRLNHCLLQNDLIYISEVANTEYDKVVKYKNMGQKSINELIEYLRDHTRFTIVESNKENIVNTIFKCIEEKMNSKNSDYNKKDIFPHIISSILDFVNKNNTNDLEKKLSDKNEGEKICREILKSSYMINYMKEYIFSIIGFNTNYFKMSSINGNIPQIFFECGIVERAMEQLVENNILEMKNDEYRKVLPTNEQWIETLKENQKRAVQLRLEGKTLEECGQILGLTRERIRQIISKAISNKIQTREDDYRYWYEKYSLDFESMNYIFNVEISTYNYLKIAYKSGKCDVDEIENDEKITSKIYANWKKYINRNSILIGDRYVPCKRELLCRELAKEYYSTKDVSYTEFYDMYLKLLKENNLDKDEKLLFPSYRAFEARISDSQYVLGKYGRRFRYYPIIEYDINELVNQIGLEQFTDVEISTLKLFNENESVMDEYNILDEYELHNLLKKTENEWNNENKYNVVMTRMPFMSFGHADRKKQTIEFIYQIAPVTLEEFADLYELEYGVLSQTVMANMFQYVSNYYHNGMFVTNQPLLDSAEKRVMEKVLKEDFYFVDDIKKIFIEYFGVERSSHLNARTIKELGFRLYANYVIRDTYSTADGYFTSVMTKEEVLDMDKFDSRLIYIQAFNQALDTLRCKYELIEYEDKKYIRFDHFSNVINEISKEDLMEYVDDAIDFSNWNEFFTIKSLQQRGFKNKLHDLGLPIWFNAALLKNSKRIRSVKVGGGILFFNGENRFTTTDFLRYILNEKHKINVDRLLEFIWDEYGIKISREKIKLLVQNSEMYYDTIMEKVYLTKDYYYEEI